MYNAKPRGSVLSTIIATIVSIGILVIAAWIFMNRQYVADVATVWVFRPTTEINDLSKRVDFSEKGEFYFMASQPQLASDSTFNEQCPRAEQSNPILGCYTNGRIFVYDVENEQLDGIEEVTAAHEMLHAVWARMEEKERERISILLEKAFQDNASETLRERMEYYQRNEPGELYNELHSIMPTEVATLGGELEEYYAQYFDDRAKIVALHTKYDSVFSNLTKKADTLFKELESLGAKIASSTESYNAESDQLSADIAAFNQRARTTNGFSSTAEFNQERQVILNRSAALEAERAIIARDITIYNKKYQEYQKVASEIDVLNKSIDSIAAPNDVPSIE